MHPKPFHGCRILVAEDDYFLADVLCQELRGAGAEVIGPAASVADILRLMEAGLPLNGAIVDINLRGEMVFPAADALMARGIPIVFATGYDRDVIPERYHGVRRCEKPFRLAHVAGAFRAT